MLRRSTRFLKKSGKPADIAPEYKQAYLPYETAPTNAELEREHQRFSTIMVGRGDQRKSFPVKRVPKNMYTYGKEGFTVPIALFKNQPDPVIGPEWTYPGIYENKIACRHYHTEELMEMRENNNFPSEWLRNVLDNQTKGELRKIKTRMMFLNLKRLTPMQKERSAAASKKSTSKNK
eukprot:Tbor_TRINITY_DN5417_c1_g1::TRINITY_DN5417_c1_g1_i1::g.24986::m.24986